MAISLTPSHDEDKSKKTRKLTETNKKGEKSRNLTNGMRFFNENA